ncbi:uncharacterized protein LOC128709233 [Anopheles marshallii]|uniref:uncharacterized protein LOC128709233 n=1 Tax=Anopheles marshallii TaxID=1521116 RepID=UPI00237AB313|nr:uncharacterized protein LOC128709233 [Anopheles marshallii]
MYSFKGHRLVVVGIALITFELQILQCQAITPDSRHRESSVRIDQPHPQTSSIVLQNIDSKAKLDGINRVLHDRLHQTRANLRPLQARAAQLQHRFDAFQRTARRTPSDPARTRTERNVLLQEAQRLRATVERKLQGFGALDQQYRSMRTLLQPKPKNAGLPRAWLDRDTERQMELNERIYKNIIDLLVHLIECPVNIIHDVMGPSASPGPTPPSTSEGPTVDGAQDWDYGATEGNPLYDEREPNALNADDSAAPWLEEFHY